MLIRTGATANDPGSFLIFFYFMTVLITTYERCYKVLAETSLKWKTLAQGRWPTDHFCDMSADRKITQLTS